MKFYAIRKATWGELTTLKKFGYELPKLLIGKLDKKNYFRFEFPSVRTTNSHGLLEIVSLQDWKIVLTNDMYDIVDEFNQDWTYEMFCMLRYLDGKVIRDFFNKTGDLNL